MDHLARRDRRWFFALPELDIDVDLALLFERSSLIWSTEFAGPIVRELPASHARIYLMRDGRSVIDALWRGARRNLPCGTPTIDLYRRLDVFETCVRAWTRHVESYLQHAAGFHLVHFENLRGNLPLEIERLAEALDLPVDALRLAAQVTPLAFRREHDETQWRERFGPEHRGLFKAIAGETLIRVGCENGYDW